MYKIALIKLQDRRPSEPSIDLKTVYVTGDWAYQKPNLKRFGRLLARNRPVTPKDIEDDSTFDKVSCREAEDSILRSFGSQSKYKIYTLV